MNSFLQIYFLAQQALDATALKAFADEVSQKDFRWWFAIVFGLLITAGTWVFKWLINALKEQRISNAEITKEFIGNMKDDRLKMMVLLERVTMVLEKLEEDKRLELMARRHSTLSTAPNMPTLPNDLNG